MGAHLRTLWIIDSWIRTAQSASMPRRWIVSDIPKGHHLLANPDRSLCKRSQRHRSKLGYLWRLIHPVLVRKDSWNHKLHVPVPHAQSRSEHWLLTHVSKPSKPQLSRQISASILDLWFPMLALLQIHGILFLSSAVSMPMSLSSASHPTSSFTRVRSTIHCIKLVATILRSVPNGDGTNPTYYYFDRYVNVLGCTDQHQFCNPTANDCTLLTAWALANVSLLTIGLNDAQLNTALRLGTTLQYLTTYFSVHS